MEAEALEAELDGMAVGSMPIAAPAASNPVPAQAQPAAQNQEAAQMAELNALMM